MRKPAMLTRRAVEQNDAVFKGAKASAELARHRGAPRSQDQPSGQHTLPAAMTVGPAP
jgi:hypothetical protein